MTTWERAQEFLVHPRLAVVGVSRSPHDFSRGLLRELLRRGYDAVPVCAVAGEVEGQRGYARLQDVSPPPEWALLLVPPQASARVVRDAAAAGVRKLWLHRGSGNGASSPEAVAECARLGIEVVDGLCPYMALPGGGLAHRLHGFFRRRAVAKRERRLALAVAG